MLGGPENNNNNNNTTITPTKPLTGVADLVADDRRHADPRGIPQALGRKDGVDGALKHKRRLVVGALGVARRRLGAAEVFAETKDVVERDAHHAVGRLGDGKPVARPAADAGGRAVERAHAARQRLGRDVDFFLYVLFVFVVVWVSGLTKRAQHKPSHTYPTLHY